MARRKNYTLDQYLAVLDEQRYSVPEIAARWHKPPAEVCAILERCGATPHRCEYGSWTIWEFSGLTVRNAEKGQRVLFS